MTATMRLSYVRGGADGAAAQGAARRFSGGGRSLVYIPGCAAISPELEARADAADLLFFDGTLFTDDEMVRTGLGAKTGRRMGHLPISGEGGSLSHFDGTSWQRRGTGVNLQGISQLLDVGAGEVWALGFARGQPRILRHPLGGEWQDVPSGFPETSLVTGWASAPDDVWVAGDSTTPNGSMVLAHWNGAAWR